MIYRSLSLNSSSERVRTQERKAVLFLSWESPWPALGGGALRTLGLLKELSNAYSIHLVVLSKRPLSENQEKELTRHVTSITPVPMVGSTLGDRLKILLWMLIRRMPYHCALVDLSFRRVPDVLRQVRFYQGVVYASYGHWGTLIRGQDASNWVLDQQNADVDFWRVYATQTENVLMKLAALMNWRLAAAHFPRIYSKVGCVVSVCEEDRKLTLGLAPQTQVDVIENGVDCSYYVLHRTPRSAPPRLLFTGTSAARNMTALHSFVENVLPLVQLQVPDVELLVGGNFSAKAQAKFTGVQNMRFTGRVDDMRPVFNQSDVVVAPFDETHGSKLKIAEAMAMGMSIVSTPEGIRGYTLVDGESVLIAKNAEEFAAHAIALLRNPERRSTMGEKARQVALSTIDWSVLGSRVVSLVEDRCATQWAQRRAQT